MQILLVQPWNTTYRAQPPAENLGLGYIAARLRQFGLAVEILDGVISKLAPNQLADQIVERDPALVGISVHGQALAEAVSYIAETVKSRGCHAHICLGGLFPSVEHKRILENWPAADSVVRGEGEHAFLQLAQHVLAGKSLAGVEGVTFRSSENEITANLPRKRILNLDELPFPARDTLPSVLKIVQSAQIQAGRGCSHSRCTFCSIAAFYAFKPQVVLRSPELVVEEIARIVKDYGCRYFHFSDDNFVDRSDNSLQWAEGFCREIDKRNVRISFRINLRADCVEQKIMKDLRQAGLWEASVGVETGSQGILERYCKGATLDTSLKALQILESLGIKFKSNLILFDPYATWLDLKSTLQYMTQTQIYSLKGLYRILTPYAGTPIRERMIRDGLLTEQHFWDLAPYQFQDPYVAQLHALTLRIGKEIRELNHAISEIKHRWVWQLSEFDRVFGRPLPVSAQELLADMERCNRDVESWAIKVVLELAELVETGQLDHFDDTLERWSFKERVKELVREIGGIRENALQLADPVLAECLATGLDDS